MTDQDSGQSLTAVRLLDLYRNAELSPVEAVRLCLKEIAEADGSVNAFCLVDEEHALAAARRSEERWRRSEPAGALDGVPIAVKDLLLTAGWPTLRGSRAIDPGGPWDTDAPSVARCRDQGGVLVGKTTTPELGWKAVTDNPLTGITRNPWDNSRTSGGSSGGSAVAVACGMVPLAYGTDGGGSIRIPASFCGVVGFKPTYGRIPLWPASPFGTLAHAGPLAITVQDAALMYNALRGPHPADPSALPDGGGVELVDPMRALRGLRVAYVPTLTGAPVDRDVARVVEAGARVIEGLGAQVEALDPVIDDPVEYFTVLWSSGAARSLQLLPAEKHDEMDPGLLEIADQGRRYSAVDYLQAADARASLAERMARLHQEYDLLVTPTIPVLPFEAGQEVPTGWPNPRWLSWTPFTYPFNLTQQPAITMPCGMAADLPVGLQIVAAKYADNLVLRAAHAFAAASPFTHQPKPAPRTV